MNLTYFFAAAAIGFVIMATITAQGIEALVSIPHLIRQAMAQDPDFREAIARRRSRQLAILLFVATAILCGLISHFISGSLLWGFWFGFVVALPASYQRFQSSNPENYEKFCKAYGDCFSNFQAPGQPSPETDDDNDDDAASLQ